MSSSCDHGPDGCTDINACNYDSGAHTDDGSCEYPLENYNCLGDCIGERDCCGLCDNDPDNNPPTLASGECAQDVICGCMDKTICDYNLQANYSNDSCAVDLSQFGGTVDGIDCHGNCNGGAVEDPCGSCIGGESDIAGRSWLIGINATVILSDSSKLYDSAYIGASIYAEDDYNNINIEEANCDGCYIDIPEGCGLSDSLCFYFPHPDWEGSIDNIFTNGYNFDKDIRNNNLFELFTNGISWNAEIMPIISETIILDSLILDFSYEGIQSLELGIIYNNIEYFVENQKHILEIGSNDIINLTFNVSNICFNEF